MALEFRKATTGICSNGSGEVHGPCGPAAGLASPLSPRLASALAQPFDALARPAVGRRSKFDCRQLADNPATMSKVRRVGPEAMRGSSEKSLAPLEAHLDGASRRQFLKGAAAAVTATSIGASKAVPATSQVKTISHGEFSVTMLSDGHLTIPTRFLARYTSEDDIKTTIGLTGDLVTPHCNIRLLRTTSDTIPIDVGAGPHYMPGAGKLAENMEAAGIERKSITKVVLTHAHPDHLWGLLDDFDDSPMFPNASYVMSTAEFEFWMAKDAAAHLPEDRRNFVAGAARDRNGFWGRVHPGARGGDLARGTRATRTLGPAARRIPIGI